MKLTTIRELLDENVQVGAYCAAPCWHSRMLDLEALGKKLGEDFKVSHDSLTPLLRCEKCGGKNVSIRLHLDYSRYSGANVVGGKVTGGT